VLAAHFTRLGGVARHLVLIARVLRKKHCFCWTDRNRYLFSVSLTIDDFDALIAMAVGPEKPISFDEAVKTCEKDGVTRVLKFWQRFVDNSVQEIGADLAQNCRRHLASICGPGRGCMPLEVSSTVMLD
jgi:hypothetical protein